MDLIKLRDASARFPKPYPGFKTSYGTAGFRTTGADMDSTVFRCGLLLAIRSMQTQKKTGICITASHNPAPDNGVKLIEPNGDMLIQSWESIADTLANADDDETLIGTLQKLLSDNNIDPTTTPEVLVAHDTRETGPRLAAAAVAGVESLGGKAQMLGLLTTPQLHWIVMRNNQGKPCTESDYYDMLVDAFKVLVKDAPPTDKVLYVDCANGVGGPKLQQFFTRFEEAGLSMQLRNTGDGILNEGCGSDYIQKAKKIPTDFEGAAANARCCAVDGDADRLLYFSPTGNADGSVNLYDGDKIAILMAIFVKELIDQLPGALKESSVGIVQTAYANGNSTKFITETLGCKSTITPTGVKHLHAAAHHYDVGIYFEANGHGTVLFKPSFITALQTAAAERGENSTAAKDILALNALINPAVGDAISGILMVEAVLRRKGLTLNAWGSLYQDLPSLQLKVKVADRTVIKTNENETKTLAPAGLQEAIDADVAGVPSGRSFVRPSGTEDVVRVYAEADTQEAADALGAAVEKLVFQLAGGVA